MLTGTYPDKWNKVPVAVKKFILRAVIILVAWKILYLVFLLPSRVVDKPLSHAVAGGAAWTLNKFTHSTNYSDKSEDGKVITDYGLTTMPLDNIYFRDDNVVSIEDPCNGLELFVLYAGFIICMPALIQRKVIFIVGGILLIHVINVLRCAGITYVTLYYPGNADFAHHYVFTFIVYAFIMGLWLIFSKKLNLVNAKTE